MSNKNSTKISSEDEGCENAIKRTLAYAAIFSYPVSYTQLVNFLISNKSWNKNTITNALNKLSKKDLITIKEGRYWLPNTKPVNWKKRDANSKELLNENKYAFSLLERIPWIKLLAVTGSVAANNATKEDDIDIFIITQANRLWLTRGFTALILRIINKYAIGKQNLRKLCCNLFVDGKSLTWPKDKQSLFVAREIVGMHPVINRDNAYFDYIKANTWVYKYFKNVRVDYTSIADKKEKTSKFLNLIEMLSMKLQLNYMKNKQTVETTDAALIHFNKHDHSSKIMEDYKILTQTLA